MRALRDRGTLWLVVCAGMLPACSKPDLRIISASATADGPNTARFTFTMENRNYTGNLFVRPGTVRGPVDVHAWSSRDGVTKFRPVSWYFLALVAGSALAPGQTLYSEGRTTVEGGIDLAVERHLILIVDDQEQKDEYNESNNSYAVPIARP